MAQTGYTPILLYSSSTTTNAPAAGNLTNSTFGSELAINITDGKLFYKDNTNAVQVIAWKTTPTTAGGTGLTTYTAGDLPYYATGTTLSKLAIGTNGQILTSTGTAPQWTTLSGVAVTSISFGTTGLTPATATQGAVTVAGTLITSNGGTGLSSYTQGDLLYYNTGTTLTALAKNTSATRYLSNTGSNNNPAWAQIDLTNGVTGTLPVGNGGTGTATAFTAGSIVFAGASGVYSQDNANLFWDDSNNRLGIGTSAPLQPLSVESASNIRALIRNTTETTSYSCSLDFVTGTGSLGSSNVVGRVIGVITQADPSTLQSALSFQTNAGDAVGERMRISPGGDVTVSIGNLIIGTSGKGIDFSATAGTGTSELLADYEEGYWTPTITCGTSGTITLDANEDKLAYTKIGRVVYISGQFAVSSISSPTGTATINNLPFAIASLDERAESVLINFVSFNTTTNVPTWFATSGVAGATTLLVRGKDNAGALISATAATYFAAGDYILNGFYLTDS